MKGLWIVALILAASRLLVMPSVPTDGAADGQEDTSVSYDGTTYTYKRFLVKDVYYCEMKTFDAGTDTYMRVASRLEGYPVRMMDDGVLAGSTEVTTFVIPAEVQDMGASMFAGCTSLEEIVFLGSMPKFADTFSDVPSGVTVRYLERYSSSWAGFKDLTKSVLPVYTHEANGCSFEYCEMNGSVTVLRHLSGTDIQIPSKLDVGGVEKDVKYIGDSAFFYDETSSQDKIVNAVLPEGLFQIGIAAFKYCEYLETLTLPSTLIVICDEAFRMPIDTEHWSRGKLQSVTLPDGLEYLGFEAFRMNYSLKTVVVPDSVTFYGDGAFRVCAAMEEITLGKGVTRLGDSSFDNCLSLKKINLPDTITSIGRECFTGDRSLKTISIPSSVTSIGDNAFSGCTSLTRIDLPDAITVGNNCFNNTSLITVCVTSGTGNGMIKKYMTEGGWALPGMASGTKVSLLIIDTTDAISVNIGGTVSGFIRITEKSVNTVGGTYKDGNTVLTGADRAGKTFGTNSGTWSTADVATVSAISSDTSLGTVDVRGGTYLKGTAVTFIAQAKNYCAFTGWSDGSKDAMLMVTVNKDLDLVASFEALEKCNLKITVDPEKSGTYTGAGAYVKGTEAYVTVAPANEEYHLIGWSDGYVGPTRIILMDADVTLKVSFGNIQINFDVNGGTVPVGPMYSNNGWKLTLPGSDESIDGKKIVAWTIDGTQYKVGSQYEVKGPVTAVAVWGTEDNGNSVWIWIAVGVAVAVIAGLVVWRYLSSRNREN